MSEATLLRAGARPVLRFERHLSQPVETVWRAVTDPAEMRTWFPTRVEIAEWKVGARITHYFDQHDIEPLPGTVLEWDPPRQVSFTWAADTISFQLAPAPDGGTVFVAHRGVERQSRRPQRRRLGGVPRPPAAGRAERSLAAALRTLRGCLRTYPRPAGRASSRLSRPSGLTAGLQVPKESRACRAALAMRALLVFQRAAWPERSARPVANVQQASTSGQRHMATSRWLSSAGSGSTNDR